MGSGVNGVGVKCRSKRLAFVAILRFTPALYSALIITPTPLINHEQGYSYTANRRLLDVETRRRDREPGGEGDEQMGSE